MTIMIPMPDYPYGAPSLTRFLGSVPHNKVTRAHAQTHTNSNRNEFVLLDK